MTGHSTRGVISGREAEKHWFGHRRCMGMVARADIADVLRRWQAGALSAREVYDWTQERSWPGEVELDDREEDGSSAAREVLSAPDQLPMNLVMAEDVPAYLAFLATPQGEFAQGYDRHRRATMRIAPALTMCVSFIGCSADKPEVRPSDRSWTTSTITVTPTQANGELGVSAKGRWSDGSDGLWIRYELWLAQSGSPDVFLIGSANRLAVFQKWGTGVSDYFQAADFLRRIDRTRPYLAVFDCEIWKAEPTRGELLAKNSVWSSEIATCSPQ